MMNSCALPNGTELTGKEYNYRINKVLGQGTFGITYLAEAYKTEDTEVGPVEVCMTVAIKEFFMDDINDREGLSVTGGKHGGLYEEYKKKFKRESLHLSKMKHRYIVGVYESFEANNTVYYSMEYCSGGTLDDFIEKGKGIAVKKSLDYIKQIASALSYMHERRMLHLDIKPANIMMRENGDVVLIDFGLSKQYDNNGNPERSTNIGCGTPGYAPMEQMYYQERENVFPATMDIYALGATLYKMLVGVRAPEATTIFNEGFPTKPMQDKSIPNGLIDFVKKTMSPKKIERPQKIQDFLSLLEDSMRSSERTVLSGMKSSTTTLNVLSKPSGAKVYVDNKAIGDTPLRMKVAYKGVHTVKLVKEGYSPYSVNKFFKENSVVHLNETLSGKEKPPVKRAVQSTDKKNIQTTNVPSTGFFDSVDWENVLKYAFIIIVVIAAFVVFANAERWNLPPGFVNGIKVALIQLGKIL